MPARVRSRPPRKPGSPTFENENSGVTISYDPVGSGGGREQFIAGGVAYAGSDARALRRRRRTRRARSSAADPANWSRSPSTSRRSRSSTTSPKSKGCSSLRKPWRRSSTRKSKTGTTRRSPRTTRALNCPETRITPVNRSDESGHDAELHRIPVAGRRRASGRTKPDGNWPVKGGEAASGTSGVVEAVAAGEGAIGYADASQAGELGIAKIKVGRQLRRSDGGSRRRGPRGVAGSTRNWLRGERTCSPFKLDRKTESEGTYPIVLTSYVIACTQYELRQTKRRSSRAYLEYIISPEGQEAAAEQRRLGPALRGADEEDHPGGGSDRRPVGSRGLGRHHDQCRSTAGGGVRRAPPPR